MPLLFSDYRFRDWCHLRPVTHTIKELRYRQIDRRYLSTVPDCEIVAALIDRVRSRRVVVTVAYNDSQAIELQTQLVARYLCNTLHLIADNSTNSSTSSQILQTCQQRDIPYVRIPINPWTGKNPSRSHGFAMNWVWQHILLPGEPFQFGFIDHDLFPTAPTDPFHDLAGIVAYGDKRWAGNRWFLWAGYCFFEFDQVDVLPLDFGLDWFAGLDTGGANWSVLYQHVDPMTLRERKIIPIRVWPTVALHDAYFEWRDDWLHEVGLDGDKNLRDEKRKALLELLQPYLLGTSPVGCQA